MSTWTAYHNRSISPQEQVLYDHWLSCVEQDTPKQLIERFQALFIDGVGYSEREVVKALDGILSSRDVEHYFRYILNRCCHILINRWQIRPQLQPAIVELIDRIEKGPRKSITELSRSRQARKLREVLAQFQETEQFVTLRRLSRVVDAREWTDCAGTRPLGTLIRRYPYLYEHCLVSEDSTQEHQQTIRRMQANAQRQFEIDLSQYVTYRVRRARLQRQSETPVPRKLRAVDNPTLLSDQELVGSLRQFSGKGIGNQSYQDSAHRFIVQHSHKTTFGDFKEDLYDYLTLAVDAAYGQRKFNNLLYEQLSKTLPQNDEEPINDFLIVRTCSQLLNFLIVDSPRNPQHYVFVDLINNLGPILTTGLLLRILLLCRKVKPYLERRFSILFNHYETATRDTVSWLVKVLENMNIALSLTFGSLDVSHLITT